MMQKAERNALLPFEFSQNVKKKERSKQVLDEDAYTEHIENIIQRDFFPDLTKLKAQGEYLDAVDKNDLVKLREIHIKYGSKTDKRLATNTPGLYNTPSTFETPVNAGPVAPSPARPGPSNEDTSTSAEGKADTDDVINETQNPEQPKRQPKSASELTLDKFLVKTTSEDNASFTEILQENEKRHREKHSWLFETEAIQEKDLSERLALPTIEEQAAIDGNPTKVDLWRYQAKNAVMYVPEGAPKSASEAIEAQKIKPREIIHENTRFEQNPYDDFKHRQKLQEAAVNQALNQQGKIGHDGKEIVATETPNIGGYGFVATPSPAPGVDESPLMTWGEIEGTPFRLDASDTPITHSGGPSFKIPEIPHREQLALELSERASKLHRAKKEKAMKHVTDSLTSPSPKFGMSPAERLSTMSAAAQRLASTKLGIRTSTDKALHASYTPSPSHRLPGTKTPITLTTPETTPGSARSVSSSGTSDAGSTRRTPNVCRVTPKRSSQSQPSLTDNLLNLPKRSRAAEFFGS